MDRFADTINTIKTHELLGRRECSVYSTKLVRAVLDVMKREGYIGGYEEYTEGRARMLRVALSNRINDIGVIKPRFSAGKDDIQKYEARYVPSKDFGMLVISTSKGVMTSRDVKQQNIGGKLLAYVY